VNHLDTVLSWVQARKTFAGEAFKAMRKAKVHVESDERILGDGDFVTKIMLKNDESYEKRCALQARGVDVDYIAGKYKRLVRIRSLSVLAVREFGCEHALPGVAFEYLYKS